MVDGIELKRKPWRAVWAYADWTQENTHDLATSSMQLYMLVASPLSWMKYAPTVERVFYVDQNIYNFLEERDLLKLWNDVIIVDFHKELLQKQKVDFFAYPKIWAYTQQTCPFFICDTDVVLRGPLNDWFDGESYYGWKYDFAPNISLGEEKFGQPELDVNDFVAFNKNCQGSPSLRLLCDYTKSISAGLLSFPDPAVAAVLGHTMLSVAKDIACTKASWVLFEEALIQPILNVLGIEMKHLPDSARFEFCHMIDINSKEGEGLEESIKQVLGFDLRDEKWFGHLSEFARQ